VTALRDALRATQIEVHGIAGATRGKQRRAAQELVLVVGAELSNERPVPLGSSTFGD
jgi:hypothetical protein